MESSNRISLSFGDKQKLKLPPQAEVDIELKVDYMNN